MENDNEPLRALKSPRWPLAVAALVLAAAGYLAYRVLFEPRGQVEPSAPEAVADAGVAVDAGPALSIDEGDEQLRALGKALAPAPGVLAWLERLGLRNLVAAAQLVADGDTPRPSLPFLSVEGPFTVREEAAPAPPPAKGKKRAPRPPGRVFVDPASFERYDAVTALVTSVSPGAVGDGYARLRPYFQAAYQEIGRPGARFDDVLARAVGRLLAVRFPEGEVELVPAGVGYGYKDPTLEGLSRAEKHLLRMGPKNGGAIQAALRDFALHAHLEPTAPSPSPSPAPAP
jgi:hypothetical protein